MLHQGFDPGSVRNKVNNRPPHLSEQSCPMGPTARSVEDETRNAELNGTRNSEWWWDFSQIVKIEKIKFLGISRYKVELRFCLDLNSEISRGTISNWDFCLIWICNGLKSPHHSGFWYYLIQHFESHLLWNGLYHTHFDMPITLDFKSQLLQRKFKLTPNITNHLSICYWNCMCKSNPVCLIQQWSVIILLGFYVQWHYFLV